MKANALRKERERSDAGGSWFRELAWVRKHRFGPFLGPGEVARVAMVEEGCKYRDLEGDELWAGPVVDE